MPEAHGALKIDNAVPGYISPTAASFVHEFGAFFVIFNSARLLKFEGVKNNASAEAIPKMEVDRLNRWSSKQEAAPEGL